LQAARAAVPADVPSWVTFRIDGAALTFTLLLATGTAVVFGLAPAIRGSRTDPGQVLHDDGRTATGSRRLGRTRSVLLGGQLALAMTLFAIAAVLVQFSRSLEHADPGFDPAGMVSARLTLPESTYPSDEAVRAFLRDVLERAREIPRVRGVVLATDLPGVDGGRMTSVRIEGGSGPGRDSAGFAQQRSVSTGYFDVLAVRRIAGAPFSVIDIASGPVVAINESMARDAFPGANALGQFVIVGAEDSSATRARVVGVVRDTSGIEEGPTGWRVYRPLEQTTSRRLVVAMKVGGDFAPAVRELRRVIQELDPLLPLYEVRALPDAVRRQVWAPRAFGFVLGVLAALALGLAMLGVYGVAAYSTILQRREIGIRLALGARARSVVALFVGRSLRLAGIGVTIGALGAVAGARILTARLGVPGTSVGSLLVTGFLLAGATLVATYLPTRRAARVDPLVTLRGD
jgi:putative ABC transport system permease protein